MIETRPVTDPERRYSMAKAAKALQVSTSALYKWRKDAVIRPNPFHTAVANGRLFLTGAGIVRIWEQVYL